MPAHDVGHRRQGPRKEVLLVMVPGMGITGGDFDAKGLTGTVSKCGWPVTTAVVDPGPNSYLDGSVEARLLDGISRARDAVMPNRLWLAGISLGCQGVLRCVRARPDLAEGVILLTPYLANTGLIAQISATGGLQSWAVSRADRDNPEHGLLTWLATTPPSRLPRIFLGRALGDRFVATATLLRDLLPPEQVVDVAGKHDWKSWQALWRLILDRNPFERQETETT